MILNKNRISEMQIVDSNHKGRYRRLLVRKEERKINRDTKGSGKLVGINGVKNESIEAFEIREARGLFLSVRGGGLTISDSPYFAHYLAGQNGERVCDLKGVGRIGSSYWCVMKAEKQTNVQKA